MGIDYDCRERMVYWTDVAGRTISRASLEAGAEPETIITSGQQLLPWILGGTLCVASVGLFGPSFSHAHLKGRLSSLLVTLERWFRIG